DFGPDGALYLTDWATGWAPNDTGRIWRLDTPSTAGSEIRAETQRLIAETFTDRSLEELVGLLRHDDMRIRRKAQFHIVDRGEGDALAEVARTSDHQLARIHAMWGLGQLARREGGEAH